MPDSDAKPDFDPKTGEVIEEGERQDAPKTLFAEWIQQQREGLLHAELTEALQDVAAAVVDLNKGGSITLEIKMKPAGKENPAIFISDVVKSKPPEDRPSTLFFTDGHGNVSRRDPRQMELGGLKDVSAPAEAKPLPGKDE